MVVAGWWCCLRRLVSMFVVGCCFCCFCCFCHRLSSVEVDSILRHRRRRRRYSNLVLAVLAVLAALAALDVLAVFAVPAVVVVVLLLPLISFADVTTSASVMVLILLMSPPYGAPQLRPPPLSRETFSLVKGETS